MAKINNIPEDLKKFVTFDGPNNSGYQMILEFPNNYGASIVNNIYSYTNNDNEFELAVLKKHPERNEWALCYETEITNDVIGNLTEEEVIEILYKIKNLVNQTSSDLKKVYYN